MLPTFLPIFIEHTLIAAPDPPLHEYAALVHACKEAHALLRERLQAHRWAQFHAKFLTQLDFVDRFIAAHTPATDTDIILFRPHHIAASVQRRWDFAAGAVTITTRALATGEPIWQGMEFAYTFDPARSAQSNYDSITRQKQQAILDHITAYVASKTRDSARHRARFAMLAAAAVAVAVLAYCA